MADYRQYSFILFISGMSVKSSKAVENFKKICEKHLPDNFELRIIDISEEKEAATNYQIFAIPTLLKISPAPQRMILGDLSESEKVLRILDLN